MMTERSKPTRKAQSNCWEFFEIIDKHKKISRCKICKRLYKYNSSTTNMNRHLKLEHMNISQRNMKCDERTDATAKELYDLKVERAMRCFAIFYRIYLTIKYSNEFNVYRNSLKPNEHICWRSFYKLLGIGFYEQDRFIGLIQSDLSCEHGEPRLESGTIPLLKSTIKNSSGLRTLDTWNALADHIEQHCEIISLQQDALKNEHLI